VIRDFLNPFLAAEKSASVLLVALKDRPECFLPHSLIEQAIVDFLKIRDNVLDFLINL
jgi:hypothetical protein